MRVRVRVRVRVHEREREIVGEEVGESSGMLMLQQDMLQEKYYKIYFS